MRKHLTRNLEILDRRFASSGMSAEMDARVKPAHDDYAGSSTIRPVAVFEIGMW